MKKRSTIIRIISEPKKVVVQQIFVCLLENNQFVFSSSSPLVCLVPTRSHRRWRRAGRHCRKNTRTMNESSTLYFLADTRQLYTQTHSQCGTIRVLSSSSSSTKASLSIKFSPMACTNHIELLVCKIVHVFLLQGGQ